MLAALRRTVQRGEDPDFSARMLAARNGDTAGVLARELTTRARELTTRAAWDDIPIGPKLMCLRYAHEALCADRYRRRVNRYVFEGRVAPADLALLWQGVQNALTVRQLGRPMYEDLTDSIITPLRALLTRFFMPTPGTHLHMNLTGPAWTQLAWRVTHLIGEGYEDVRDDYIRRVGFHARSVNGLHELRIMLAWRPLTQPPPTHVHIRYVGPQHFYTFGTAADADEYMFCEAAPE